jgi:hypothetical protein
MNAILRLKATAHLEVADADEFEMHQRNLMAVLQRALSLLQGHGAVGAMTKVYQGKLFKMLMRAKECTTQGQLNAISKEFEDARKERQRHLNDMRD